MKCNYKIKLFLKSKTLIYAFKCKSFNQLNILGKSFYSLNQVQKHLPSRFSCGWNFYLLSSLFDDVDIVLLKTFFDW